MASAQEELRQSRRRMLEKVWACRFGPLPSILAPHLDAVTDVDVLEQMIIAIAVASDPAEAQERVVALGQVRRRRSAASGSSSRTQLQ